MLAAIELLACCCCCCCCSRAAASLAFASSSRLVGGSGGRFAWSSVGGSRRVGCPSEVVDSADTCDMSLELEPRLAASCCVEGLRGGSAGDGCAGDGCAEPACEDGLRLGRAGGCATVAPFRAASGGEDGSGSTPSCDTFVGVRRGSGGRDSASGWDGVAGLPCWSAPVEEGCFGRLGGGGGGARFVGAGALKFFCLLRAAIRSARVTSCGSSVSAIFQRKTPVPWSDEARVAPDFSGRMRGWSPVIG